MTSYERLNLIVQAILTFFTFITLSVSVWLATKGNKETRLLIKNETSKFARKAILFAEFNYTALRLEDVYNHP